MSKKPEPTVPRTLPTSRERKNSRHNCSKVNRLRDR